MRRYLETGNIEAQDTLNLYKNYSIISLTVPLLEKYWCVLQTH